MDRAGKIMQVFNRTLHHRMQVFLATVFFLVVAQAGFSTFDREPPMELGHVDIETLIRNPGY